MGILDTAKELFELVQKADNIDLYRQTTALQQDIMKLLDENRDLRDEVRILRQQASIAESLEFSENAYYRRTESGREGPFCPTCWDREGKLVRLLRDSDAGLWCAARH
jgi:regulator of replication initiation timing